MSDTKSNIQKLPVKEVGKDTTGQSSAAQVTKDEDWYTVPQPKGQPPKLVPTAVKIQKTANTRQISTFVTKVERDDNGICVYVKGVLGGQEHPDQVKEAVVDMDYQVESTELILSKIMFGKVSYKLQEQPSGRVIPILTNPRDQISLLREMNKIRRFALRTLITKAEAVVQKKLLGHQFMEVEEQTMEAAEVALVNRPEDDDRAPTLENVYYILGLSGFNWEAVNKRIVQKFGKQPGDLNETDLRELWSYCQHGEAGTTHGRN